jgi:beta-fructofuranosidase
MTTLQHKIFIDKANAHVFAEHGSVSRDPHRLSFHLMAPAGWINDPNGLIYYNGEYHVFYQHHPYSAQWGPMHWGHAKSRDLVRWEHLPVALAPSESYDEGCFSGSAVDDNGVLTLVYTGHADNKDPKEVQCIATSTDGIHFEKYGRNPVIAAPPAEGSADFRDPKVWRHGDAWYMVVGSGKDGIGKALLYRSLDLREWSYMGVAAQSDGTQGHMWECPDLFSLGDKHVLIISPMGMDGSKNIAIIGTLDYETGKFTQERWEELDYGPDFYAAQTFSDDQGRRLLFGWMNMWGTPMPTQAKGWAGAMTLPRVLALLPEGKLMIQPAPELEALRRDHWTVSNVIADEGNRVLPEDIGGECLEIVGEFQLSPQGQGQFGFKLRSSKVSGEETVVLYDRGTRELLVNRDTSGVGQSNNPGISRCRVEPSEGGRVRLHIFLDRSSVEVFANGGRAVITQRIYPNPQSLDVGFYVQGEAVHIHSMDIWRLGSIW